LLWEIEAVSKIADFQNQGFSSSWSAELRFSNLTVSCVFPRCVLLLFVQDFSNCHPTPRRIGFQDEDLATPLEIAHYQYVAQGPMVKRLGIGKTIVTGAA
jgi:hypothetical protein